MCTVSLKEIEGVVNNEDVTFDHHMYEGISKYNMFFAGWLDSYDGYVQSVGSNYKVAYSPFKLYYENTLRAKHKENNNNAQTWYYRHRFNSFS